MFDWVLNTPLVKGLLKQGDGEVTCFLSEFATIIYFYTVMYFYTNVFITTLNK